MPSPKQTRRNTVSTRRPALPKIVPADLPGWHWAQNPVGELALVAPGGESTPWFLREAEVRALAAARAYQAERPHLVGCHTEVTAVAQTGWVARALPTSGWELHPRGRGQARVAMDDTGLRAAIALLQAEPQLDLGALCEALRAAGAPVALVGDDLVEAVQSSESAEQQPSDAPAALLASDQLHELLKLSSFDRQALVQEWGLVQQALSGIDAVATLALLHAAQARLSEGHGEL